MTPREHPIIQTKSLLRAIQSTSNEPSTVRRCGELIERLNRPHSRVGQIHDMLNTIFGDVPTNPSKI